MINVEPVVLGNSQFYLAHNGDGSTYAWGETPEEATSKMETCPRTASPVPPSLQVAVGELIRAGKISDELRFIMLDYEAHLILEVL